MRFNRNKQCTKRQRKETLPCKFYSTFKLFRSDNSINEGSETDDLERQKQIQIEKSTLKIKAEVDFNS